MLAVLGPGDHRQARMHGAALGGVVGDRVAEFGISVVGVQEVAVGPAALAGTRAGVEGPADEQAAGGDGLDAEQVALARVRPGSPASVAWSLRVQMIRSPGLARVPSAMVTAGLFCTMPRAMRSSRMRPFSSRRSACDRRP